MPRRLSTNSLRSSVNNFRLVASSVRQSNKFGRIGIRRCDSDEESCCSASSEKSSARIEKDSEEKSRLLVLENQLEEIEKRKELDLQNIEEWKKDHKWKLDQQRFRAQLDYFRIEKSGFERCQAERKDVAMNDMEIQKLLKINKALRSELFELEKERTEIMADNVEFRTDYQYHDVMATVLKKQTQAKFEKNKKMRISRRTLKKQIQREENDIQHLLEDTDNERQHKQVHQNANIKIIDLLHSRCTNHNLVFDAVILKNKAAQVDKNIRERATQIRAEETQEIILNQLFDDDCNTSIATMASNCSNSIKESDVFSSTNKEQTNSAICEEDFDAADEVEIECHKEQTFSIIYEEDFDAEEEEIIEILSCNSSVHSVHSVYSSDEDCRIEETQNTIIGCLEGGEEDLHLQTKKTDIFQRRGSTSTAPISECSDIAPYGEDIEISVPRAA